MGWTEQQLADYTRKRLKDEQRTRLKVVQSVEAGELQKVLDDPQRATQTQAAGWNLDEMKTHTAVARSGYNEKVVTAFFREHGIAAPIYEFRFCAERKWRLDICWVPQKVCVECQGGLFSGGAHVRGAALLKEHKKLNELAALGWRVIFCTPQNLCMKETADLVKRCLNL